MFCFCHEADQLDRFAGLSGRLGPAPQALQKIEELSDRPFVTVKMTVDTNDHWNHAPSVVASRAKLLLFGLIFSSLALAPITLKAAFSEWSSARDPDLGFAYSYPGGLFARIEGDGKPSFHYFASADSAAKFLVGGWNNTAGQSPESFKRWVMENVGGYDVLTYRPRGRSWFVLSGYREDQIYYEKVMFSCGGELVNVFAITYPIAERDVYDPIVERMENTFKPGRRCPA